MRRIWLAALSALTVLSIACSAHASIIQTGMITLAEDNDFESVFGDGDVTVEPGEYLLAIAEFPDLYEATATGTDQYFSGDGTTPMLTAVSLLKIATSSGPGTTSTFTFTQPTQAEWVAVLGLAGVTAANLAQLTPSTAAGAMFLMFEDPAPSGANTSAPHLSVGAGATLESGLVSASEGLRLYEFGFTGPGGTPAGFEFFTATTVDSGGAANDITAVDALFGEGAFNLIPGAPVNGPTLLPHNYLGGIQFPPDPDFTGPTDLQLVTAKGQGSPVPWQLRTDTDFFIHAIPEPGSIAVFGLLIGSCFMLLSFKRNRIGS